MNVATRAYNRGVTKREIASIRFSGLSLGITALALGLLLSAFGVIYAKDLNRRLSIQYQGSQQAQQQYQADWSKLLLEQGTWSTQSRIQLLAQRQNMIIPSSHNIVLVEDENETLAEND